VGRGLRGARRPERLLLALDGRALDAQRTSVKKEPVAHERATPTGNPLTARERVTAFTKEELLREVWGFRSLGRTRTLDSHASRLRRKLSAAGGDFVRNVWGVGYSLLNDST
jgi:DNA-binding response OmpR family regulator